MPYTIVEDAEKKLVIVKAHCFGEHDSLERVRAAAVNKCPRGWDVVFNLESFDNALYQLDTQGE